MEFDDLLREFRDGLGEHVAAIAAAKFVDSLTPEQDVLLVDWLRVKAPHFVAVELIRLNRSDRGKARHRATSRAFADAVTALEEHDDGEPLSVFANNYVVNTNNLRRPTGDMTGADHEFVAAGYEASGNTDLMFAAFHHAVAVKVGKKRTRDVMDEDTYLELMRSILGSRTAVTVT